MKKIIVSIILIILVITGVIAGCFFFNQKEEKKEVKKPKKVEKVYTGIFGKYEAKAKKLRKSMTLDEKIGQIFLVRYEDKDVYTITRDYNPGGYILFAKDFAQNSKEEMQEKLKNINTYSKIPLAYAVDEEGGIVNRVSKYPQFRSEPFKSPQDYYNEGDIEKIKEIEQEKADLLLSLGINMNLAPVADVSQNPEDFIYKRSLGQDANTTASYIKEVVKVMKEKNITGALKHFPGYGNNVDTHTGIAIDERDYESFKTNDFIPFSSGITEGVPAILVSHNVIKKVDETLPASLSKKIHDILRQELNFTGIILTDDLAMDAIGEYTKNGSAPILALSSGNDLIITSNFIEDTKIIKAEVTKDQNLLKRLNEAVDKILSWKYAYKILK